MTIVMWIRVHPYKATDFENRSLRNPWTDRHQNSHGWLCRGPLPLCKILSRYDYPPLPPKYAKMRIKWLGWFFLVLPIAYSQDPYTDFHDQYVKWRGFAQGCALWGSRKQNFTFRPHFPSKTANFWTLRRDWKFCVKNGITMGMLTCKLPLIVIVAQ